MKALKILTLIFLCSVVHLNKIYAQSQDYVITNKGDTLKGQFTGKRFKANGWDKAKRLHLYDYKEIFHADDSTFMQAVVISGTGEPEFMRVIEKGKINLYMGATNNMYMVPGPYGGWAGGSTEHLFVSKGTDTVKELDYSAFGTIQFKSKKKRINVLSEMLMDNKDVYEKFVTEDKFTPVQIENLIHLYNTGKPYEGIKKTQKLQKPQKEDTSNDFNPSQN